MPEQALGNMHLIADWLSRARPHTFARGVTEHTARLFSGEQFLVAGCHYPVRPVYIAANSVAGAHRFKSRVDAENEIGHLLYAGIVSAGVEDSQIDIEMLPVIAREAFRPRDFVAQR